MASSALKDFETLYSLCKRRGFMFQSAEIYGGLNACFDYGPLGTQLKKNLSQYWWNQMVRRKDIVGLDSAILSHQDVLKASGHVDAFTDPLVDCLDCKARFRPEADSKICPECQSSNITSPREFNLMFKTKAGSLEGGSSVVYLRPETAQGIYVNFQNIQTTTRKKLPFGVAQVGKAFRNEITPGPFTFRTREFEQMEMQYFILPNTNDKWFEYWREKRLQFYKDLDFRSEHIRCHDHKSRELAHYANKAIDIEYLFPIGWKELEGIHDRGDYDLSSHQKLSKKNLEYTPIEDPKSSLLPHIIETSVGLDRLLLALLCESYREEKVQSENRVYLALPSSLAPIQVAFLPLSKKADLIQLASKLRDSISEKYLVDYDESGSIGRRYRRQDEIGTPFCVTVDFESLEDEQVTVRSRDSMKQKRVSMKDLERELEKTLK